LLPNLGRDNEVASDEMLLGVAQTGSLPLDENLAGGRRQNLDLLDRPRFANSPENGPNTPHVVTPPPCWSYKSIAINVDIDVILEATVIFDFAIARWIPPSTVIVGTDRRTEGSNMAVFDFSRRLLVEARQFWTAQPWGA
jgi:hypothetical protein